MVNEYQRQGVRDKPVKAHGPDRNVHVSFVAATGRDQLDDLRAEKGNEHGSRGVNAGGIVEEIHQQAGAKRKEKYQYRPDLKGEKENKPDVDKAEGCIEQNEVADQQHLGGNKKKEIQNLNENISTAHCIVPE